MDDPLFLRREDSSRDRAKSLRRSAQISSEGCLHGIGFPARVLKIMLKARGLYIETVISVIIICRDYVNFMEPPPAVTSLTLLRWCEQVASGMEHLARKEVKHIILLMNQRETIVNCVHVNTIFFLQIIHGDLAARNVLVFKNNVVKITDFGMSRQLDGSSSIYTAKPQVYCNSCLNIC